MRERCSYVPLHSGEPFATREPVAKDRDHLGPVVHEKVLAAAARQGVSVSAWMTNAARESLRPRAGVSAIAAWENSTES